MNSADLKAEGMAWLRYCCKKHYLASECGQWNADLLGADEKSSIEIETKVTKADLRADFRKPKHKVYVDGSWRGSTNRWISACVPNRFFFMVPEQLIEEAQLLVAANNPKYGILTCDRADGMLGRRLRVVKKADFLHREKPSPNRLRTILLRMSSELATMTYQTANISTQLSHCIQDALQARSNALDAYVLQLHVQDLTESDEPLAAAEPKV